jgi:hypothetical protein
VPEPLGPFVAPGTYTVRLIADGDTMTQPVRVRMDPRVKTPAATLAARDSLQLEIYRTVNALAEARRQVTALRASVQQQVATTRGPRADSLPNFDRQLAALEGSGGGRGGRGGRAGGAASPGVVPIANLPQLQNELMTLYSAIEDSDNGPTTPVTSAARSRLSQARTSLSAVRRLSTVVKGQ